MNGPNGTQMATFDNFNFPTEVSYSLRTILICELVHGEANRLLIHFKPLHVPHQTKEYSTFIERKKRWLYSPFFQHFFRIVNAFEHRFRPSKRGKTFLTDQNVMR